jgi:hypothetical protein
MNDQILEQQPNWRFCRVRAGEKRPYPANWQRTPLTLAEVDSENIGIILGAASAGTCAIDFDGPTAIDWFQEQFPNLQLPVTPTWTSGKAGRCQMAFTVDSLLWNMLQTKKIATAEREGIEFRWTGAQSVLPPSVHPDTGQPYQWLIDASHALAPLPTEVLTYWTSLCNQREPDTEPEVNIDDLTEQQIQSAQEILAAVKQRYPQLNYDQWRTVAWATAHHLGRGVAEIVLREFYPEQHRNEYRNLFQSWHKERSPTWGTVCFMAGKTEPVTTGARAARNFIKNQNKFRRFL